MSHRKWKETKQEPCMLPGPAVPGCCLISFHFPWAILCPQAVYKILRMRGLPTVYLTCHTMQPLGLALTHIVINGSLSRYQTLGEYQASMSIIRPSSTLVLELARELPLRAISSSSDPLLALWVVCFDTYSEGCLINRSLLKITNKFYNNLLESRSQTKTFS